ncbi:MAG: hypothetical protein DSY89_00355, partial [Deltaproteobacteria bacterium]
VTGIFDTPTVDLAINASVDLAGLNTLLPSSPQATGRATIRLQVDGAVDNPDVRAALDYGGGMIEGQRVDALAGHFNVSDRQMVITDTAIDLPAGHLALTGSIDLRHVFPDGWIDPAPKTDSVQYDLAVHLQNGLLDALPAVQDHLQGTIQSDLALTGTGISPKHVSCKGKLRLTGPVRLTTVPGFLVDLETTADFGIADGRVDLHRLAMTAGTATLEAAGHGALSGKDLNGRIAFHVPDLGMASPLIPGTDLSGSARLSASVSGSIQRPEVSVVLDGESVVFDRVTLGDIGLNIVLDQNRRLSVSNLMIKNRDARIKGAGSFALQTDRLAINRTKPMDISLVMNDVAAANFIEDTDISGRFSGRINLAGTLDQPAGEARITGKNIQFPAVKPMNLTASFTLKAGILRARPLSVVFGSSAIDLKGRATLINTTTGQWMTDPIMVVRANGRQVRLSDIFPDYRGIVDLTSRLEGPMKALTGTFQIKGRQMDLNGQILPHVTLAGRLAPQKLSVDTFEIQAAPEETISGKGWYRFDRMFAFSVQSGGIRMDRVDYLRKKAGLSGQARFSITGQGTLDAPQITGVLTLSRLAVSGLALDDIHLEGTLTDQKLRVTGRQAGLALDGVYRMDNGIFSANLSLEAAPLAPYFAWKGKPDLSGNLTGKVTVAGDVHDLEQIDISGTMAGLSVFFKQNELIQADRFNVSYRNETLSIPALECRLLKKGSVTVHGRGHRTGPIRLAVDGDIPLEVLAPFSEALTGLTGHARLSATASGTLADPRLAATLDLSEATFPVPGLDQSVHGLTGQIHLSPQTVSIEQLRGRLDTGRFFLSGNVNLNQFQPVSTDLRLSATALPFHIPDTLDLLLDAELTLNGPWDASTLGGTLVLLEGTYTRDLHLNLMTELSKVARKKRTLVPLKTYSNPFLANLGLNIDVRKRQPFRVDNDMADLEVNPDLKIAGTLGRPILTGKAEVISGRVKFEQRKFTLRKGLIAFLNPYRTEPSFDISGKTSIRTWDITLTVTGTPDALRVDLQSRPPLARDDIVSLLVLGKTSGELIEGEGGLARSNTQLMADLVASTFGDDIRRAAGLDLLEVETIENGENGQNGGAGINGTSEETRDENPTGRVKVTIGKNLSRRLAVRYAIESKDGELTQRADADYQLREHLLVSGFQGSDGLY